MCGIMIIGEYMKFKEYVCDGNCIVRSFYKMFNYNSKDVSKELDDICLEFNYTYDDVELFEEYLKRRNMFKIEYGRDMLIRDLKLDGKYIIFCSDNNNYYHMVPVINNTVYDKSIKSLDLYVISIYM